MVIMSLVCRACMQIHPKYVSLFDYHENGKMLSELLVECVTIKIQKDDGLPTHICNYCLKKLTTTWDFFAMIIETDLKLRTIYKNGIKETVMVNSNVMADTTLIKEESVIVKSDISHSLIQENMNTNNYSREECSLQTITCTDKYANLSLTNNKQGQVDNCNTVIPEITAKVDERERITSKCGKDIDNVMKVEYSIQQSVRLKLLNSEDFHCDTENVAVKNVSGGCILSKNIDNEKEVQKIETEKQDIIQATRSVNNIIEDEIMLEDNSQYHSDESINNFDNSKENITKVELGSENVNKKQDDMIQGTHNINNVIVLEDEIMLEDNNQYHSDESINDFDNSKESITEEELGSENVNKKLTRKEKEKMSVFCKTCNRSFGYRYYFEVHIRLHNGDKKCKCDICGKSFVRQFQLRLHMTVHSDERPFSCEICGKTFKTPGALYSHKNVHAEGEVHTCSVCQKSFKSSSSLKTHFQRHTSEKKYTCEVCGKSFVDGSVFSKHKLTHVEGKNFPCPTCKKEFSTKVNMRHHLRLHSEVRPHSCSYCDKSFKTKDVMDAHILIHTGEKPYSCKVCDKSFRQSAALYNHMRIHTGESPYACKICSSRFKYSHHLQNHMKVHK